MDLFFSLILPVYQVEPYIDRCMQSILSQSFSDYEVILVDDGSPDNCPAICDAYASQYNHVRVIHKPNGGLASARNAGLEQALGKYVWFVDADDWIEDEALKTLFEAASSSEPDVLKFGYCRVEGQNKSGMKPISEGKLYRGEQIEQLRIQAFCADGKYVLSAWSHVYRRDFLVAHDLTFVSERTIGSEDYLFNLEALLYANTIQVLPEKLYYYDLREGSLTRQYKKDLFCRYMELYRLLRLSYDKIGAYSRYENQINRFVVWHLLVGTCFAHEYHLMADAHSLADRRRNVRQMLNNVQVQEAISRSDRVGLTWQRRIQLLAMKAQIEPLFYWLFVVRTKKCRRSSQKRMKF